MNETLSQIGYSENPDTRVWSRPNFKGIEYSDGDDIEQRIEANIAQTNDISILSLELRRHCIDWPSVYHLSGSRANLLRPLAHMLHNADVLELGAGCGAITRYLGEQGANVLALEGSLRRARIARSRTRDLKNVTVVADRLADFSTAARYDIVTLIGVLEYASVFSDAEQPALSILRQAGALLKPNGRLVIAIENQLGLKYFAGYPEDHIGQPMYGVEGRYKKGEPQTWGRKALHSLLLNSGFKKIEFCASYPDYKLPVSIVSEHGFSDDQFDASVFGWQNVRRDPQYRANLAFSPELVHPILAENGIALDMANSFLVIAGLNEGLELNEPALAWHYSTERKRAFCKETRFLRSEDRVIKVKYKSLAGDEDRDFSEGQLIRFSLAPSAPYIAGRPLSLDFIRLISQDGWRIEDVGTFLKVYLRIISVIAKNRGQTLNVETTQDIIPGEYFDCVPGNIIIRSDGSCEAIDQEWELAEEISVGYLLFRALHLLIIAVSRFGKFDGSMTPTPLGFIQAAFEAASFPETVEAIESYAKKEARVQADVSGTTHNMIEWIHSTPLPGHSIIPAAPSCSVAPENPKPRSIFAPLRKLLR